MVAQSVSFAFVGFCLRAFVMILQKPLQNAPKIDVISSMASQMFSFLALAMI